MTGAASAEGRSPRLPSAMPLAVMGLAGESARAVARRFPFSSARLGAGRRTVNYTNEFARGRQLPFYEPAQRDKIVLNIQVPTLRHWRRKTSS